MQTDILWKNIDALGTPSYVFDIDELKDQIRRIQNAVGDNITLCYAMKANPFLVSAIKDEIAKFEVCSPGEFLICKQAGIDMKKIVLSGVNKEKNDVLLAMHSGVEVYTVESELQLELINTCAKECNNYVNVLLRLSSGNQFGMDMETIENIVFQKENWHYVNFIGLQLYSGTQKRKVSKFEEEIDKLDTFCKKLTEKYGISFETIEYGPGLGVDYFESDDEQFEHTIIEFGNMLKQKKKNPSIVLEMGRIIASGCGYYLTRIVDHKKNMENNYCIIDGGINHINYYGQIMGMKIPKIDYYSNIKSCNGEKWNICGSLCTSADVVVKNFQVPSEVHIGDLLVFKNIGAYSVTEGIYLFLSRKMPRVFFYTEKGGFMLVRDVIETYKLNTVAGDAFFN